MLYLMLILYLIVLYSFNTYNYNLYKAFFWVFLCVFFISNKNPYCFYINTIKHRVDKGSVENNE